MKKQHTAQNTFVVVVITIIIIKSKLYLLCVCGVRIYNVCSVNFYQNNEFMMMTGLTSCSSFVPCLKLYFSTCLICVFCLHRRIILLLFLFSLLMLYSAFLIILCIFTQISAMVAPQKKITTA